MMGRSLSSSTVSLLESGFLQTRDDPFQLKNVVRNVEIEAIQFIMQVKSLAVDKAA